MFMLLVNVSIVWCFLGPYLPKGRFTTHACFLLAYFLRPNTQDHGFGTLTVRLTIAHPQPTNTPTIGCTSISVPSASTPPGAFSSTRPFNKQNDIIPTIVKLVGAGKPSKYFDLPVASFGKEETVTLKRARRVRAQRTKKDRNSVSSVLRRPSAKAEAAGATPKETFA